MKCRRILNISLLLILSQSLLAQICTFPGDKAQWSTDFGFPGVSNGQIRDMVVGADSLLYAVGYGAQNFGGNPSISRVGVWNGDYWIPLEGVQCSQCGSGSSYYNAVSKDNQGNLYFLGFFEGAQNPDGSFVASKNVIQYNVFSKQFTALGKGIGGGSFQDFNAIAWRNDTLFVGGRFTEAYNSNDTIAISNVAYFDLNQQKWFDPNGGVMGNGNGLNGAVNAISFGKSGEVFIGGAISQAGTSTPVNGIARWKANQGWDNAHGGVVQILYGGTQTYPGTVQSLAYDSIQDKLYAGGIFGEFVASASVYQQRGLAVYNGSTWSLVNSIGVPNGTTAFSVNALYLDNDSNALYIGGSFQKYSTPGTNNPPANRIVKLNLSNQLFSEIEQGVTAGNSVYSITPYQGKLYFGGSFIELNDSVVANNFASWDGQKLDQEGNGLSSSYRQVNEIIEYQGGIIVAGQFSSAGPLKDLTGLALWDGQKWEDLGLRLHPNYQKEIRALKLIGNQLWVGGNIYGFGNTISKGIGVFDLNTKSWTTFGAGISGSSAALINAIEVFQGEVYIGGSFSSIDGVAADHLAKWNGSSWSAVASFPTAYSDAIDAFYNQGDSLLYIGGQINSLNNDPDLSDLVIYDGSAFRSIWSGLVNGRVRALAGDTATGTVYFGGDFFSQYYPKGSNQAKDIYPMGAIVNGDSIFQVDLSMSTSERGNTFIYAIEVDSEGHVIFGGRMAQIDGHAANHIARYHPQKGVGFFGGGIPESANSTPVKSILTAANGYYFGGSFNFVNDIPASRIAFYEKDNFLPLIPDAELGTDSISAYGSVWLGVQNPQADESFLWNTGDTETFIVADSTAWYSLLVSKANGCTERDSVFVTIMPALFLKGGNGDGFSLDTAQISFTSFYRGNSGDGFALNQAFKNDPSFYGGGLGDGFAHDQAQRINPSFYLGGLGDGYARDAKARAYQSFYRGGDADGYALNKQPFVDVELNNLQVGNGKPSPLPQTISVEIKNVSFEPVSQIPVHIYANGIWQFSDTIANSILPGASYQHNFSSSFSPDSSGSYDICAISTLRNDINTANDSICKAHIANIHIEEHSSDNWEVYPNPANESLQIYIPENQEVKIYLFDQSGKLVLKQVYRESQISLEVAHLATGLYSLRLQSATESLIRKVMILH
ncbi:T9SS type A sorting domain-containing protein [Croceimicrobium hydrocarbonivorans]|uniref:T9SS type A sorting domain-containing protein n=1 Tax=Croceimicrobium hydrocarbonivorans TaxID=2761580 RepID=A0A7H0VHK4_9FLAO|nr:T9SS type A sorting domain-containing protein [Croceimicrobium hydrocarbonivorans]QNR25202.1 T9SS type A sorting domain-containing protein [Croceimicrobium hydrocarbonivorans]